MIINPANLYNIFVKEGIEFFTGVPDSTLKYFCFYLDDHVSASQHVIAANEGNSVAIAAGYYLSTGKIPLVYMQNSGLGNAINPLTSLINEEVYSIPLLMMIGWRGEPNTDDAAQHEMDGRIQLDLLNSLELPYAIIPSEDEELEAQISDAVRYVRQNNSPFVILSKRNSFDKIDKSHEIHDLISREEAINNILRLVSEDSIIVSTTGKTSRELYECQTNLGQTEDREFLVICSMGHASSIALGISIGKGSKEIFCLDGDGALIMHMGALSTIGKYGGKNFKHILLNNFVHDSVGGQPTSSDKIDYRDLSKSLSYKSFFRIKDIEDFDEKFNKFIKSDGP